MIESRATTLLKRIQSKSRHSDAGRSSSLQKAERRRHPLAIFQK